MAGTEQVHHRGEAGVVAVLPVLFHGPEVRGRAEQRNAAARGHALGGGERGGEILPLLHRDVRAEDHDGSPEARAARRSIGARVLVQAVGGVEPAREAEELGPRARASRLLGVAGDRDPGVAVRPPLVPQRLEGAEARDEVAAHAPVHVDPAREAHRPEDRGEEEGVADRRLRDLLVGRHADPHALPPRPGAPQPPRPADLGGHLLDVAGPPQRLRTDVCDATHAGSPWGAGASSRRRASARASAGASAHRTPGEPFVHAS